MPLNLIRRLVKDAPLTAADHDGNLDELEDAIAAKVAAGDLATVATTGAYADLNGGPALGTAAAQDVGTGASNVVQLDGSGRLPAVDGSQLTNLPGGVGPTDLSYTAASRLLASSTGADVILPLADGTDAGLMSSGDYVKLLGVEAGATGDQTALEIQIAYESLADRNAFTDAEQIKLAGIQAGAEVNVNADWSAVAGDAVILNKPTLGTAAGLDVGATAGTVAAGDDARLSDARTPTAHKATHATGQPDALTPADIGAATAAQGALAASAVQPGDIGTAAAQDVGVGAGDVVQLDGSGRLPAVDGSQLTNLPSGASSLDGLTDVTITGPQNDQVLKYSGGTWINAAAPGGGGGTVTSVGIVAPTGLTVSGSPVTTSGNITLAYSAGYEGFLSADKTKLDGIAAGAEPNVATDLTYTAATRVLASSTGADATLPLANGTDPGLMAAADFTKLLGVESGAQVNVATDLTYTSSTRVLQSSTGNNVTLSLANGVDPGLLAAADYTKLLGIETGATADQTGAEIKAAYEAEVNTNAFTDAEQTKLAGIETGADVTDTINVTAAGALMDSEVTNLAQVKAFDSADYATAAQGALADSATQPGDLPAFPSGAVVGTTDAETLTNKTLGDITEGVSTIVDGAAVVLDPRNVTDGGYGAMAAWNIGANNRTATLANFTAGTSLTVSLTVTTGSLTVTGADWGDAGAPTLVNGENDLLFYSTDGVTVKAVAGWKKAA